MVGNSSSGLIEAPSLGTYTVNIGDRQAGRVRGNSVIDVACDAAEIEAAMNSVLTNGSHQVLVNPYYKKNTANEYYMKTKDILAVIQEDIKVPKHFYDIKF